MQKLSSEAKRQEYKPLISGCWYLKPSIQSDVVCLHISTY